MMFYRNQPRSLYMDISERYQDCRVTYKIHAGFAGSRWEPAELPEAEVLEVVHEGKRILSLLDDDEFSMVEDYLNEEGEQEDYDGY